MTEQSGEHTVDAGRSGAPPPGAASSGAMPDSIGGYRILGKLGEGGMGVVYEAEQQEPRRRVALKVIRGGVAVDEVQVRMFQREVETLARLKHPDIGAIYESGRTADGLHWFAMELVRGPDLSAYLSLRPKSITPDELRHRLRLAARIALAVHYAHQRGVIHRDLKPSNIIVTEERSGVSTAGGGGPDVKILDFGLARLTDEDLQLAETLTIAGAIKGTLPYMSPEQARGESAAIDVRTDVYALGIVLYEMLTGQRPYDVARASLLEAVRVICEEPPRSMSVSWSGQRRLDGDVETIVGKALEKDPSRRYGSAAALAEDIERYLNSEPIAARPPSAAYQIRKFTERHRALVLGAAATSLAVLAGLLVSTALYFRAEREKKSAQQVSRFLASMLEGVGAQVAQGRDTALLREILQKTTERIGTELGGDPEIEANLRSTMGVAYYEVADFAAAEAQYQRALELYTGLRGNSHMDVALQLSNLGLVAEAKSDFPGAEARLRQAVEIARRAGSPADPKIPEFETRLANMIVNQARYDDARVLLEESLARQREIFRGANSDLAVTLNSLGNVYHYQGKLEAAEACYREALAMHREVLGDSHPFVATDLLNIGLLLDKRGNLTEAESALRDALARFRALYPGGNDHTTATLSGLASLLQRAAKYDEAEALAREAVAINEQLFGQRSAVYARSLDALAVLLVARGEGAAADAAHLRALEIRREIYGPRHPDVASSLNNLGMRKLEAANFTEAEQLLGEAVEIQREASGVDSGAALVFMNNLARAREGRGDLAGAEQLYLEVLERRRAVLGKDSIYVAVTEYWLSRMLRDTGRAGEAEPYQREAAAIMNAALGPAHVQTAIMEIELGEVLTSAGKPDESEALLRGVLERAIASDGAESRKALDARLALGRSLTVAGRPAEALQELDQVLAAPETALSGASRGLARIYHGLALAAAGRVGAGRTELEAVRREFSAKYGPDHRISRIAAREAAALGR